MKKLTTAINYLLVQPDELPLQNKHWYKSH